MGARKVIQVVKVFVEAASAKSANRPQFQRMFAWLEQNRASITHVVCDKWDRFSRSVDDSVMYRIQLKAWRKELISATQPVTDDPAGRLMQNILQSFGQFENEQRAERSAGGVVPRREGS
jgi:DNA invertase Pin-like site-specific DNA recombinase